MADAGGTRSGLVNVHDQTKYKVKRVWGQYTSVWKMLFEFFDNSKDGISRSYKVGSLEIAWMVNFLEVTLTCTKDGQSDYVQPLRTDIRGLEYDKQFQSGTNYTCEVEQISRNAFSADCDGFLKLSWVGIRGCEAPITDTLYTTTAQTKAYYWRDVNIIGKMIY